MLKSRLVVAALIAAVSLAVLPAMAASLAIKFTNRSGESITQLSATPRDAASAPAQNILTGPIANGATGQATITSANGSCVFTLTFTSASGKTVNRPDTDLCQTDGIIIE